MTKDIHPLTFIPGCNTTPEVIREQLKINIRRYLPWLTVMPKHSKSIAIVAGGPSLAYRWPEIEKYDAVLSLNNTYSFLLERGITPDYWMLLDARRENIEFVRDARKGVQHFLAAQCHPDVYERLNGLDTTLYLTTLPDTLELTKEIAREKVQLAGVVGTVGTKALALAFALGYRDMHLFGYDSSYAETHHAYPQTLNDGANTIDVYVEGRQYITTPSFAHQAQEFPGFAKEMTFFHDCSIELHCDGLLPHLVDYGNREGRIPLEKREQEKYEMMWEEEKYRRTSPGEALVECAVQHMGMLPGETVLDFGCGSGLASKRLQAAGMDVTGVDFASNCLGRESGVPFVQACLWGMPALYAKWGYCTDVMEHIPIEKVDDVIRGISERCDAAFFSISTMDDKCGLLIGRKLHVTVMNDVSWGNILKNYWRDVMQLRVKDSENAVFICRLPVRNISNAA